MNTMHNLRKNNGLALLRIYLLIFVALFSPLNAIAMGVDSLVELLHEPSAQLFNHHHHHEGDNHSIYSIKDVRNASSDLGLQKLVGQDTHDHSESYEDCSEHTHCSGHTSVYLFVTCATLNHKLQISSYHCSNQSSDYQALLKALYRPPIIAL